MLLRFYAREDQLVNDPAASVVDGQPIRRVGRAFMPAEKNNAGAVIKAAAYPATKEAHEVDSKSEAGARLALLCRRDACLWPADEATAAFCSVEFAEVDFMDGAWVRTAAIEASEEI